MRTQEFLASVKASIKQADANAQVILFGSRARGTARNDSDWDILILASAPKISPKDEQIFTDELFDIELETGQAISTLIYSAHDWNTRMAVTPLYQNVKQEGIYL